MTDPNMTAEQEEFRKHPDNFLLWIYKRAQQKFREQEGLKDATQEGKVEEGNK